MNEENTGRCLCGKVTWAFSGEPFALYNCHCRMCQKIHGAAFGTYSFIHDNQFRWTSSTDTVTHYVSSNRLTRSSCSVCGSVVPFRGSGHAKSARASNDGSTDNTDNNYWCAPAGCHDTMRKPDCNIFVSDNAPWHKISGNQPQHDAYPPESGNPGVKGLPTVTRPDQFVRGSCLCGDVEFRVTEPFKLARNCHCSRCRYGRSTAHACNGFVSYDGVEFISGENKLREFKVPDAQFFTQVFCTTCSSLMPRKDAGRGISVIPMGSLDDDPGIQTSDHIFTNHMAGWHEITDGLVQHPEGPPSV